MKPTLFSICFVAIVFLGAMLVKASSMDPIESKQTDFKKPEKDTNTEAGKEKEDEKDQHSQKQFAPSSSIAEQAAASIASANGSAISVTDGVVQTVTN